MPDRSATIGPQSVTASLVVATLLAWAMLLQLDMMTSRPLAFFAGWGVMMSAMMLPSIAPLVLIYRQAGRTALVLGYLLAWTAFGVPVYALSRIVALMDVPAFAVGIVLAVAGAYQFTPLKDVCLRTCRSPLDFLALRWGRGPLRLGIDHAVYCIGCCWGLMAVLVVAAVMNVVAAALIAALVFAEKVLPGGRWTARATGVALIGGAFAVIF